MSLVRKSHAMLKLISGLFIISGIIFTTQVFSQTKYVEVVYLKNGTVIRGLIIEFIPDQSIKIKTNDGNIFFHRIEEIEKITREPYNLEKITINNKQIKQSGFTNYIGVHLGMINENSENFMFGLHNVSSYLFNPYFSVGVGIGIEQYIEEVYFPLFLDIHTYFSHSIVSPFFSINLGRQIGSRNYKGGLMINPSFGVKAYFNAKMAIDLSLGYRFQGYEYENEYYSHYSSINFLTFKSGITF